METEYEEVCCPKCGSDDVVFQEKVYVERSIVGIRRGVLVVDGCYKELDDSFVPGSEELFCRNCAESWGLGAFERVDYGELIYE
jgi:hypothetical protein